MAGTPPWADAVPAEWWERLAARIIEALVFGILYYILFIALWAVFRTVGMMDAFGGRLPGVFAWALAGLGYTGYDWWAHWRHGRTFGQAIMRIRLSPPGVRARALLKRSLLYPGPVMLMGIPVVNLVAGMLLFGIGMLILIDKPLERGPHDRLAGTHVVKDLR
ncbi:RDD family protein [Nonomuraea longispora]|uniref:RDD family protein n=1 Tax=Nonomuraea longispora TaxID=1848320 RepID=A0A4R4NHP9_9ACTN|nr:RDD family protein [Nonomuraea longispora]TDC08565.1 RDD family protein [Nonomuraea longispora]